MCRFVQFFLWTPALGNKYETELILQKYEKLDYSEDAEEGLLDDNSGMSFFSSP